MDDLRNTMLTSNNGSPVYVKDVATVIVGHKPRLGIVGQDDDEDIVQGVVLMRRGEQSLPTIRRVEAEVGLRAADLHSIVHGTTLVANTVIERTGAAVGLITT